MSVRNAIEAGLARLGVALNKPYDRSQVSVYADVLCDQTTAAEFAAFVDWGLRGGKFGRWQPSLPELQDALRAFRGHPTLDAEATTVYERVLGCREYNPESGAVWSFRRIREELGEAAANAFLAAGGHSAFATTLGEDKRLARFVSAYKYEIRDDPHAALPDAELPQLEDEA